MTVLVRLLATLACCVVLAACGSPDEDCGGGDGDRCIPDKPAGVPDPDRPSGLLLHPVELRGGSFVEGFIASYDVDPIPRRGIDGVEYDAPEQVDVPAGRTNVRVLVYPCESRCPSWDQLADRHELDLANERASRVRPQLVRCETSIDLDADAEAELTPVVVVGGPEGATCSFVDGDPGSIGPEAVNGIVVAAGDDVRICTGGMFASLPPSCGDVGRTDAGETLRVEGLDLDDLPGPVRTEAGVTWTERPVTLVGTISVDTLRVDG